MGLFRRRKDKEAGDKPVRLFYASDIHGTEVLWRKFLNAGKAYEADVLVMGGDLTGKAVIPLVGDESSGYEVELFGERRRVAPEEVEELERQIRGKGMYPHRMSAEEVERVAAMSEEEREEWFAEVMLITFRRWLELAEERLAGSGVRCIVMPGNDDPPGVDEALEQASYVEACDGRVVEFDGYTMISLGYSNPTPFDSPRELPEEEIARRVDELAEQVPDMSRCIFNLHVPPYDSQLDTAPELDEDLQVVMQGSKPKQIPVGSTAVRAVIERHQPLLSLHGHVHESPGAVRIGRTLCINPGSDYHTGRISGCLLALRGEKVTHQFVNG
ncbi:MAG: metallophosphoesterase [Rubrobacteraceae bacterium]|nr:metallophosphoesterase [Rubrobacteraceae bacterium]MCL6649619.1 metallophosphoesterase [Chloroflexota bacterium]